uniref:Uncharacterized protein n=1 Tax=Peronospora matthiolae TaxID=2874970 RepID=A0AAV1UGG5_9STRA
MAANISNTFHVRTIVARRKELEYAFARCTQNKSGHMGVQALSMVVDIGAKEPALAPPVLSSSKRVSLLRKDDAIASRRNTSLELRYDTHFDSG